ncbi:hypothetical protein ACH4S8_37910 [Streptomyces sp. NPDC021080]|uniref:DUF7239 family protein n=1 Tax=Streptomyces sp. NPDC021080 TaxID=3365110 RepID=UPI00378D2726
MGASPAKSNWENTTMAIGRITEEYEPREDKLPEWAQRKLGLLRQLLADERKASAALRGDIEHTDTLIRHHEIRPDHLLPAGSEITFVPDLSFPHRAIDCKLRDGWLEIYGERAIVVRPRQNNGLSVGLEG